MEIAKLINDGNNQVIILPKKFHLEGSEVYIKKVGDTIILIAKDHPWQTLFDSLDNFSNDFMENREEPNLQVREDLF
jgi:antitoxin VapB